MPILACGHFRLHHALAGNTVAGLCKLPSLHLHLLNAICLLYVVASMHGLKYLRLLCLSHDLRTFT